jgi:transposase InsO family protein
LHDHACLGNAERGEDLLLASSAGGRGEGEYRWRTRVELANAIFEYLEIFHNRQRRHSALDMHTPIEYETIHQARQPAA